jgi:hypothetical protein
MIVRVQSGLGDTLPYNFQIRVISIGSFVTSGVGHTQLAAKFYTYMQLKVYDII